MQTLTIDGRECTWEGKKSILEVALDNNVEIPHYCYHPGMSIAASCRICLAEVGAPNPRNDNKVELIPKLVPTCQTPAAEGMEVNLTNSPKTIANQKSVMEMLLINHPLDCPVCDQAGECSLQDYSYSYGRSQSRFEETKIKQPKKDLGPNVLLYSDRCIMCSRCVRFTREVTGTSEIGIFGRGSSEQIDVFPGKPLDNELAGNVVDICPVGALLDKDFLMSMRVWNLKKTASIDGITASGDNLSIETNEDKVYRVKPRTNMDVNTWWTSDEIRYGWKFVHRSDRLRSPMHKVHGVLEELDWNAAYAQAFEQLELNVLKKGRGTTALVVSPMLASEEAYLLGRMITAIDEDAVLAVGPVPFDGEDKTFPGGYTVYAEKAPNARGVRRALEMVSDEVLDFDTFMAGIDRVRAMVLTGNYPSEWATPDVVTAAADPNRYTVVIDTLPSALGHAANLVLPGATWVEKSGSFENVNGRHQHFEQALPVIELAKTEGQIALDLLAVADKMERKLYNPFDWRTEMGDAFATDMYLPDAADAKVAEVEYVQL
ncbi:MAG: molybdopterin-dependent oxidoreductase [Planctomycetota bacterium]